MYKRQVIDSIVTQILIRIQYPDSRFIDALKVALVGVFFGAVTPSNTGGQPMQLYLLSKMKGGVGFGDVYKRQGVDNYWENITAGVSGIDTIKSFDASELAVQIAGEVKNFRCL